MRQLVQPALECLRRELALRSKLGSRERDLDVRERDLSSDAARCPRPIRRRPATRTNST